GPVAVLADTSGQLWLAAGSNGVLAPVVDGNVAAARIDDVALAPAGDVLLVGFSLGKTGEYGQSLFGSAFRLARLVPDGEAWRVADVYRMPRGPLDGTDSPLRLAGVSDTSAIVVVDGAVVRMGLADGERNAI